MRNITATFFCLAAFIAEAQIGGRHSFEFLQVPAHARLAGLGGVNVSLADRDVNFFHNNPALVGDTLNGVGSAGYQFYIGDIGNALITYAHDLPNAGQIIAGIQHMDFGTLTGYDERGAETSDHRSGETAILIGRAHQIGHFRMGVSFKGVFSNIAGYRAAALMMDVGGIFKHPHHEFTAALVLKNVGLVYSDYRTDASSSVPFDVQAGVTFKPEHMPVRFSLTAYNLTESELPHDPVGSPSAIAKVLNHVNAGAEILLHRNVNVLLGYNYLLRQSLKWETGNGAAGVCYGLSLLVKPVEFIFSRSAYAVGNAGYSFTLSTNTNQLLKKRF